MIVCIAEKPTVGRDIAKVLGATTARDGYMEGNGYQVTWTFGHLCSLLDPQDYDDNWKRWNMSQLPMIPRKFGIKVMDNEGIQKQFNTIKQLFSKADEIINCGDAGQEGELIQRWVMQKAGVTCPVKRLWISSLTEDAIREGFKQVKEQKEYNNLYEAGLCRAIGDWLLGMNATRAYTLRYREFNSKQILSVGRVQTPTLALIVARDKEIERFVPRKYWEIKTLYRDTTFSALVKKEDDEEPIGIDPIPNPETGQALIASIEHQPFTVTSVEKKKGSEAPPRLFDLTSLQVECNKKFNLSADDTLKIIQSLYEKKITTYPRVDTTFLSEDIYPKCPNILRGIESYFKTQIAPLHGTKLPKSKKVFDNKKVTDHHAIIPTGQQPNNLTEEERKVFNLVALRFIAVFYPDCKFSTTTVMGEVTPVNKPDEPVVFRCTGKEILHQGWRVVFADTNDNLEEGDNTEEDKTLPLFKQGESGEHKPQLIEKETTPPKHYTEATLLRAMETAGKTVENEELRDALKENGIGRPSTRAAIIEKLYQRQYIKKLRKSVVATPIGIELINKIHSPLLKSAELTGQWEKKLREIEHSEYQAQQFIDELKQMTTEVVRDVKLDKSGMLCPLCRQGHLIRGKAAYGCSRWKEGCSFREPFPQVTC